MTENENNDKRFKQEADDKKETEEPEPVDYKSVDYGEGYAQQKIDELTKLLEKEKEKSLRLQADYQNLEKQTIDRINIRGDKIILDFLTVYEDFVRAKSALINDGVNSEGLEGDYRTESRFFRHTVIRAAEKRGLKVFVTVHAGRNYEDNRDRMLVKATGPNLIFGQTSLHQRETCPPVGGRPLAGPEGRLPLQPAPRPLGPAARDPRRVRPAGQAGFAPGTHPQPLRLPVGKEAEGAPGAAHHRRSPGHLPGQAQRLQTGKPGLPRRGRPGQTGRTPRRHVRSL